MPRSDICKTKGCKRWITSKRLEKGLKFCSICTNEMKRIIVVKSTLSTGVKDAK